MALVALPATALEFRSTVDAATILYDGPSLKSQKIFVVGRDYPFEVVVSLEGWAKVRDIAGAPLAWVERKALSDRRMVVVKSGTADVLASAEPGAKTVFRVEQISELEAELSEAIARINAGEFRPTPSEYICAGCPALDVVCAGPRLRSAGYAEHALATV